MRCISGLILVCAGALMAQTSGEPEVIAAKAALSRVQELVDHGAAPRAQLTKAQDALADAEDVATLRKTAYGQELTAEQADEMLAAAGRRVDRRKKALEDAQKLVDAGVATPMSLVPLREDLDRARKESDLADSRAQLTRELAEAAQAEEAVVGRQTMPPMNDPSEVEGVQSFATFAKVEVAFEEHFGKKMPISAVGQTAVHRSMGFDHRGRVDVALNPDDPEGAWLVQYLVGNHIPYFAFRHAVPGKATGAHIHIGPTSTKLVSGGL